MRELFRIVKGNAYSIKVYVEKVGYDSSGRIQNTAVNLLNISNLSIYAFRRKTWILLPSTISSSGKYVTITIPNLRKLSFGKWGICLKGSYNNNSIASTEHNVFSIVPCNAKSYIPYGIVEGEHSYIYNLKFSSGEYSPDDEGGDDPQPSTTSGYIGFATFNNISEVSLNSLEAVNNLFTSSGFSLINTTEGARLIVVCSKNIQLNITIAGLPAGMNSEIYGNYRYYYTTPQRAIADAPYLINITKM